MNASLAGFDRQTDPGKRRANYEGILKFVLQQKRQQIMQALAEQAWSPEEIDRELANFGIKSGLFAATPEQIEEIWTNYRTAKML